jgi:hypothetical protein
VVLLQFLLDEGGEWVLPNQRKQVTVPTQMCKGDRCIGSRSSYLHGKGSRKGPGVGQWKRVNQVVDIDGGQSHKETSQRHGSFSYYARPRLSYPLLLAVGNAGSARVEEMARL